MMRLKLILLTILTTLTALQAKADNNKWLEVDLHAGIGLSTVLQNYGAVVPGLTDFMLTPGCQMRGGVGVRINMHQHLGLSTGLEMGINNFRYAMSILSDKTGSMSSLYVSAHYYKLTVPVYLSWRMGVGQRMQCSMDLGLYLSEGLGGDLKASGYTSGENSLGQQVVTHSVFETKYYTQGESLLNKVRKFDFGPRVAAGLVYKQRIKLETVLEVSARNLAENQGVLHLKYRNLSLMFQLGYIF